MTVKVGGKTYKGKYRGPDQFKGDMTKVRADAAKRKLAKTAKTVSKPAVNAKAAPKATTPAATTLVAPTVPNPGAVGSNSSGNISLQSNLEIEQQALDANEQLKQENERATQLQQKAAIEQALGLKQTEDTFQEQRGQTNAKMAYRGMRGTAALNANAMDKENYRKMQEGVNAQKGAADIESENIKTAAQNWWGTEQGKLNLARRDYTDKQSAKNPTTGSSPINSGLAKTTLPAESKPKVLVKKPVAKAKPKTVVKKFKGKYPGPDKYKGNKALIAAAKRKVVKK